MEGQEQTTLSLKDRAMKARGNQLQVEIECREKDHEETIRFLRKRIKDIFEYDELPDIEITSDDRGWLFFEIDGIHFAYTEGNFGDWEIRVFRNSEYSNKVYSLESLGLQLLSFKKDEYFHQKSVDSNPSWSEQKRNYHDVEIDTMNIIASSGVHHEVKSVYYCPDANAVSFVVYFPVSISANEVENLGRK